MVFCLNQVLFYQFLPAPNFFGYQTPHPPPLALLSTIILLLHDANKLTITKATIIFLIIILIFWLT